jgi:surface protein
MLETFDGCNALTTIPTLNTTNVANMNAVLRSTAAREMPAWDLSGVSSAANFTNFLGSCKFFRIRATGARFTHTIANNCLSGAALNEYYTGLPTVTSQTLTVTGNYGTTSDDPTIATAKGWTVTGS